MNNTSLDLYSRIRNNIALGKYSPPDKLLLHDIEEYDEQKQALLKNLQIDLEKCFDTIGCSRKKRDMVFKKAKQRCHGSLVGLLAEYSDLVELIK